MRAAQARVLVLSVLLTISCGENETGTTRFTDTQTDGGDDPDGPGRPDGSSGDAGHDVMSGDKVLCTYDDGDVVDREAHGTLTGLSTATDEQGFALLHHGEDGSLLIEAMEIGEPAQPAVRLVAAADAPGRALIASSRRTFAMLWMNGGELTARMLAQDGAVHALSDAVLGEEGAELFAFAANDGGYWAAYAELQDGAPVVRVQAIAPDGELDGEAIDVALPEGAAPLHLELARVDAGFLVAYSEVDPEREGAVRVIGIALDALLEPRAEEPLVLSKKPAHEPAFALDARTGSAGLIYQALEGGLREAVKVQRVETDGSAPLDTWNVVSAPRRAQDGSIAAFGQGYAVAYRALPSLGNDAPAIRIAFVDDAGLVVHDAELAATTEEGGPTSVRSTIDGKLLVSWNHQSGGSHVTRSIQLDCPGALVLCGGVVQ